MTDWPSYNKSFVRRGAILFIYNFLDICDKELEKMNKNKNGKPYSFPNSFIIISDFIWINFHLPYRQTEGIIKATLGRSLPNHPSYGHIYKRINKLNDDRIDNTCNKIDDDDDNIIIAIDITGIKITNGGQWRYMINGSYKNKKKGYLKNPCSCEYKD